MVLRTPDGRTVDEIGEAIGVATNNVAEYAALVRGLRRARELGARRVVVHADSELLVRQLQGAYAVRHEGLRPLFEEARRLLACFEAAEVRHVPREENREADRLANAALDRLEHGERPIERADPAAHRSHAHMMARRSHHVEQRWTASREPCHHVAPMSGTTLAEKVWERHVVRRAEGEPDLLYVDLHLVHEVTSPQAFDGLRLSGRKVRRPDLTLATMDHNVPTAPGPVEPVSERQMDALRRNCEEFGIRLFPTGHIGQGIVHVIGPQMGLTQPGMLIVCGDSHTSTHGAFGALAFGIGTSEVEHVLATQTLPQPRPGTMAITVEGELPRGVKIGRAHV